MNKLCKSLFLLLIALSASNSLKAMDNDWKLMSVISNAGLLCAISNGVERPWKQSIIGAVAGACSVSLWYCHAHPKFVKHRKQGLHRSARNIGEKLDSVPQPAIVYFADEPIGCVPNYTGPRQRERGPCNLPENPLALREMLQDLQRRETMFTEGIKTDNRIFLSCVLPTAISLGITSSQLISGLRHR